MILLSARCFHERITAKKLAALVLTILGLMLVTGMVGSGSRLSLPGILFGLGAGLGYALYSIFSRFAIKRGYAPPHHHLLHLSHCGGDLRRPGKSRPYRGDLRRNALPSSSRPASRGPLHRGTLCLYTTGLQYVENGAASIIASVEPVTSTVVGVLLYGEVLSPSNAAGVVLVLFGVVISSLPGRKPVPEDGPARV
ncbi:MAG: DMT family transporter [Lachnospiraceae bacterium]|nr:DMT family transporter [Lachnospiraceae bacterium]MCI1424154.1 DMT family transporter [Lachnospiraceae bacterium]MCI1452988.1 DMT family transporter [Lachnospiraceae bacterium]